MHGIGAHSALAIKRQRRRRDGPRKAKRSSTNPDHYEADNKVHLKIKIFSIMNAL